MLAAKQSLSVGHRVGGEQGGEVQSACDWGHLLPLPLPPKEKKREDTRAPARWLHATWNCDATAGNIRAHPFHLRKILDHLAGAHKLTLEKSKYASHNACISVAKRNLETEQSHTYSKCPTMTVSRNIPCTTFSRDADSWLTVIKSKLSSARQSLFTLMGADC